MHRSYGPVPGTVRTQENDADAQRIITLDGENAPQWVYDSLDTLLADVPLAFDGDTYWQECEARDTLTKLLGIWLANKLTTANGPISDLLGNVINEGDKMFVIPNTADSIRADVAPWL